MTANAIDLIGKRKETSAFQTRNVISVNSGDWPS